MVQGQKVNISFVYPTVTLKRIGFFVIQLNTQHTHTRGPDLGETSNQSFSTWYKQVSGKHVQ